MKMMKDDFKAVSVLASDYCAYDLADHLADVRIPGISEATLWMIEDTRLLARLALDFYPGGATGLLLALMGIE